MKPETSYECLLLGSGIFLLLFYICPIVPYAPAFLQSSRLDLNVEGSSQNQDLLQKVRGEELWTLCNPRQKESQCAVMPRGRIQLTLIRSLFL